MTYLLYSNFYGWSRFLPLFFTFPISGAGQVSWAVQDTQREATQGHLKVTPVILQVSQYSGHGHNIEWRTYF